MFPEKQWSDGGLNSLLKRIKQTNSIERKQGSGRPKSSCTQENIEIVEDFILSDEDKPGTHLSQRKIAKQSAQFDFAHFLRLAILLIITALFLILFTIPPDFHLDWFEMTAWPEYLASFTEYSSFFNDF